MRLIGCLFIAVVGVSAQAGAPTPIFTHSGPLACGMRVYIPGQVQRWCFDFRDPAKPKTICNAIDTITPATPGDTPLVAASNSCFGTVLSTPPTAGAPTPCASYQVSWLVWQPIVAIPPGTTGTIVYQIAASQQSGTVNTLGACVPDPSIPPTPAVMQQGSFSSGILAAGLQTWQVNGDPQQYSDLEPNKQWNLAAGPGIVALSSSGITHAVTPDGLCVVQSADEGTAGFVTAAGKTKVCWLPTDWCPDGLGTQPKLTGACGALGMSMVVNDAATGHCSATPDEPAVQLANAVMYFWNAAPTIQGR